MAVRLDPWQNIVNVHWGDQELFLVLTVRGDLTNLSIQQTNCDGATGPAPSGHVRTSLIGADAVFGRDETSGLVLDPEGVSSVRIGTGGDWAFIPREEVSVSGLPASIGSISAPQWAIPFGTGGVVGSLGRWAAPSGAPLGITAPVVGQPEFVQTTEIEFVRFGDIFTGGPDGCYEITLTLSQEAAPATVGEFIETHQLPVSVAGVAATYQGDTYAVIGAARSPLQSPPTTSTNRDAERTMFLLCQKQ